MLFKIADLIKQSGKIAIIPHVSADGDAIGSSVGLALALTKMGKKACVYLEEEISKTFLFIPGKELIKVFDGKAEAYGLAIALDSGDEDRLGGRKEIFRNAGGTVNIDHHMTNTMFAQHNYVDTNSAAVSEIIYDVLKILGQKIDKDIANCLYMAIVTDTGGFKYSNTTSKTHHTAGELIDLGADTAGISQQVFDNTSLGKLKLTAKAIESLELFEKGKVAVLTVTDAMLRDAGAEDADCEGLVNIARNIKDVEVGIMLREKDQGLVKVNLRSREYADVAEAAAQFKGGGHKRAAGFTAEGKVEEVKARLLEVIRKALVI